MILLCLSECFFNELFSAHLHSHLSQLYTFSLWWEKTWFLRLCLFFPINSCRIWTLDPHVRMQCGCPIGLYKRLWTHTDYNFVSYYCIAFLGEPVCNALSLFLESSVCSHSWDICWLFQNVLPNCVASSTLSWQLCNHKLCIQILSALNWIPLRECSEFDHFLQKELDNPC